MTIIEYAQGMGFFAVIVAAITWLLKSLGNNAINKNFKKYELNLESEIDSKLKDAQLELDKSLERHKTELQIEHSKQFKLQERRLLLIEELYEKLTTLQIYFLGLKQDASYNSGKLSENNSQIIAEFMDALYDFGPFFEKKKIYFSAKLSEQLHKITAEIAKDAFVIFYRTKGESFKLNLPFMEQLLQSQSILEQGIDSAIKEAEKEFRSIIGVNEKA